MGLEKPGLGTISKHIRWRQYTTRLTPPSVRDCQVEMMTDGRDVPTTIYFLQAVPHGASAALLASLSCNAQCGRSAVTEAQMLEVSPWPLDELSRSACDGPSNETPPRSGGCFICDEFLRESLRADVWRSRTDFNFCTTTYHGSSHTARECFV